MVASMTKLESSAEADTTCLVCQEQNGVVAVPGGILDAGNDVVVFHVPLAPDGMVSLGHMLVTPRRHVADFAGLDSSEAAETGVQIHRYSAALKQMDARRVYIATIGHAVDHLHVHLLPRWPETPPDVAWHAVDEWPGARRGTFDEASALVVRLRSLVPE
jgi:histidine triad (HIT) family protein